MRLVFLLYAEDEALMPTDAVYEQNYKVSGIFEQLQQDAAEFPDTMEQRFGAWAGLMSLCRLVFDGGGPSVDYLPARHGQLFDPAAYPWLETPWISDGVVLSVLSNLLIGERRADQLPGPGCGADRLGVRGDHGLCGAAHGGPLHRPQEQTPGRQKADHHGGGSGAAAGSGRRQAQDVAGG